MKKNKMAIITGASGQDAYYLSKILNRNNFYVLGTTHSEIKSRESYGPFFHEIYQLNLLDKVQIDKLVSHYQPEMIFHLAARASSADLFNDPYLTAEINGISGVRLLDSISKFAPKCKFCFASSSEIYAGVNESPQSISTIPNPINPYGYAKNFASKMVSNYRLTEGIFSCNAILYNHESIRRPKHFLTRKITSSVAEIYLGKRDFLNLGAIDKQRDWGYAPDYVFAMLKMMENDNPNDYHICTGVLHTIKDLCEISFSYLGLDWNNHVQIDHNIKSRIELSPLTGDAERTKRMLDWSPSISFKQMITKMIDHDIRLIESKN